MAQFLLEPLIEWPEVLAQLMEPLSRGDSVSHLELERSLFMLNAVVKALCSKALPVSYVVCVGGNSLVTASNKLLLTLTIPTPAAVSSRILRLNSLSDLLRCSMTLVHGHRWHPIRYSRLLPFSHSNAFVAALCLATDAFTSNLLLLHF